MFFFLEKKPFGLTNFLFQMFAKIEPGIINPAFENLKKLEESRIKNLEFSRIKTCGFFFGFAPLLEHSRISFWILNSKFRKLNLKKKQKQYPKIPLPSFIAYD